MCFEFMGKVPLLEGTEISHGYKTNKFVPPLKTSKKVISWGQEHKENQ